MNPAPVTRVVLSKLAEKQLRRIPETIRESLTDWIRKVQRLGLREARKIPGFHDEPLQGYRWGQRSVRLNRSYRAIYLIQDSGVEILVLEVSKHAY